MPIKGLTDRQSLRPQLARLGKLRKGAEKTINEPGKDLSFFRPDFNDREVQAAFEAVYGQQPRVVNVVLFFETLEENFSSWLECWDASGLVYRSDGEYWRIWRDGDRYQRGQKQHVAHEGETQIGRFEFVVPELIQQGHIGTVTLETSSNHDIRHISNILYTIERERGGLRGTELMLMRVAQEISVPGWGDRKGKRSRVKKWLVKLKPPRQLFEAMLEAPASDLPRLEDGVDFETGEIVVEEPQELPEPQQPPELRKAVSRRQKLQEAFNDRWMQAQELGLDDDALPKLEDGDTNAEIIEKGKALAAIIASAEESADG